MSDLGDLLRQARAYKNVTLRDAERSTRISRHYLAALEAHDFDQLPARTYSRGIVKNYAQYLELDPAVVLNLFEQMSERQSSADDVEIVPAVQPLQIHGHWAPNFAIIAFMLFISAVAFTWIYSAYLQPSDNEAPVTIAQPTATAVEDSLIDLVAQTPTSDSTASDATLTGTETPSAVDQVATEAVPSATPSADTSQTPVNTQAVESTGATQLPDDVSLAPGTHVFSIYAENEVWVQVSLDGGDPTWDGIMAAGDWREYIADSATITSGNAAFVQVFVDGDSQGTLGEPWDVAVTYP